MTDLIKTLGVVTDDEDEDEEDDDDNSASNIHPIVFLVQLINSSATGINYTLNKFKVRQTQSAKYNLMIERMEKVKSLTPSDPDTIDTLNNLLTSISNVADESRATQTMILATAWREIVYLNSLAQINMDIQEDKHVLFPEDVVRIFLDLYSPYLDMWENSHENWKLISIMSNKNFSKSPPFTGFNIINKYVKKHESYNLQFNKSMHLKSKILPEEAGTISTWRKMFEKSKSVKNPEPKVAKILKRLRGFCLMSIDNFLMFNTDKSVQPEFVGGLNAIKEVGLDLRTIESREYFKQLCEDLRRQVHMFSTLHIHHNIETKIGRILDILIVKCITLIDEDEDEDEEEEEWEVERLVVMDDEYDHLDRDDKIRALDVRIKNKLIEFLSVKKLWEVFYEQPSIGYSQRIGDVINYLIKPKWVERQSTVTSDVFYNTMTKDETKRTIPYITKALDDIGITRKDNTIRFPEVMAPMTVVDHLLREISKPNRNMISQKSSALLKKHVERGLLIGKGDMHTYEINTKPYVWGDRTLRWEFHQFAQTEEHDYDVGGNEFLILWLNLTSFKGRSAIVDKKTVTKLLKVKELIGSRGIRSRTRPGDIRGSIDNASPQEVLIALDYVNFIIALRTAGIQISLSLPYFVRDSMSMERYRPHLVVLSKVSDIISWLDIPSESDTSLIAIIRISESYAVLNDASTEKLSGFMATMRDRYKDSLSPSHEFMFTRCGGRKLGLGQILKRAFQQEEMIEMISVWNSWMKTSNPMVHLNYSARNHKVGVFIDIMHYATSGVILDKKHDRVYVIQSAALRSASNAVKSILDNMM